MQVRDDMNVVHLEAVAGSRADENGLSNPAANRCPDNAGTRSPALFFHEGKDVLCPNLPIFSEAAAQRIEDTGLRLVDDVGRRSSYRRFAAKAARRCVGPSPLACQMAVRSFRLFAAFAISCEACRIPPGDARPEKSPSSRWRWSRFAIVHAERLFREDNSLRRGSRIPVLNCSGIGTEARSPIQGTARRVDCPVRSGTMRFMRLSMPIALFKLVGGDRQLSDLPGPRCSRIRVPVRLMVLANSFSLSTTATRETLSCWSADRLHLIAGDA